MLASKDRFHGRGGLRRVFRVGTTVRNRSMMIRYAVTPHRPGIRVAVIVAKKVMKSACGRNRIRRRVFEIVRHERSAILPGSDIVITITSADVLTMPHPQLTRDIQYLLSRVRPTSAS